METLNCIAERMPILLVLKAFVCYYGITPLWRQWCRLACVGVEAHHHRAAYRLELACRTVHHHLQHVETLVVQIFHLRFHHYALGAINRGYKVAVDIGYHYVELSPVVCAAYCVEILRFAYIEIRKIHRVVQMPEHIEVVKPHLHFHRVPERAFPGNAATM